mmetsp:Transcript_12403/g.14168  ORF Transcript_12403/g.14168 Transcript_12403/m.14168 type:complete len:272 (-) Transcript_12403:167-982(-)
MAYWASSSHLQQKVQFMCVCVESKSVAIMFQQMFFNNKSTNGVVNGYIPSRDYMPVGFGQLGCSGFVISDGNGNFVSRKTAAYLQVGERAFQHVEAILADLLGMGNNDVNGMNKKITNGTVGMATNKNKRLRASSTKSYTKLKQEEEEKKDNSISIMTPPKSVGIDSMDDEHEECTNSFNRLIQDPCLENLEEIFLILQSHFKHEEDLIEKHSSSSTSSSTFSALTSHRMDHERILSIAQSELDRLNTTTSNNNDTSSSTCSLPKPGQPRQ